MMKGDIKLLYGHPIHIATIELQRRKELIKSGLKDTDARSVT